ncbi:hypothetical protein VP01_651g1 [Puccinia sorghi]|uniref:Uncharacterized protein n=1 Tax=Puccinia sorghi TaxID=27349 RepID=A0A0L6UFH8_9BASI|nr:hypothetical protein VP01_651g1 [Puccinia sorghi]
MNPFNGPVEDWLTTSKKSKISNASYAQNFKVLNWNHQNGKNQSKNALHFANISLHLKIKQPLISKGLKDEANIPYRDFFVLQTTGRFTTGLVRLRPLRHSFIKIYVCHGTFQSSNLEHKIPPNTNLAFTQTHEEESTFHLKSKLTTPMFLQKRGHGSQTGTLCSTIRTRRYCFCWIISVVIQFQMVVYPTSKLNSFHKTSMGCWDYQVLQFILLQEGNLANNYTLFRGECGHEQGLVKHFYTDNQKLLR